MSNTWQEQFIELTKYVAGHPEIVISETMVSIPESVRPEFYRLFGGVRRSFAIGKFPDLIEAAEPLAQSFAKTQQEVEQLLGLESVVIPDSVKRFIKDPVDGLIRVSWSPLFDLLKKKLDPATFVSNELREVKQLYDDLHYQAYEDWLELALLKLFKAKHLLRVNAPTISGSFGHAQGYVMHLDIKPVIPPEESKELSLVRDFSMVSFTVPDFIVYSAELGKYASVKAQAFKASWVALDPSESREWLPLDNKLNVFEPGYLLIYVDDNPLNLALVNDVNKICRPDIVLEFREKKNWYSDEEMQKVKAHNDMLKPKLGTFIVSREPVREHLSPELEEGIRLLNVGIDDDQLRRIIDVLKML